jgi:prevent-host-death family protein
MQEVPMQTVGAYEAKTHLPKLLEQVAMGEAITITKHGVPVALLTPIQRPGRLNRNRELTSVIEDLRALKRETSLSGLSIKELIEEGRRF